jgi:methyltransferase (TIGR00027 family)
MESRPSRTAMRVALRRAAHQILDEPKVFDDPLALRVVGRKAVESIRSGTDAGAQGRASRALRAFLAARSRYASDMLASSIAAGVEQHVVLGAGLETSAFGSRPPGAPLRVFEVDHPATQGWKREVLERAGIPVPESLTFVPLDFETRTLSDGLLSAGFDPDKPAFFSWLGVVPYLTRQAIVDTFAFVGSLPKATSIVFDYGVPPSTLGFLHRLAYAALARRVAKAGEPFRTFFAPEDLASVLRETGFHTLDDLDGAAINARYVPGRSDGLHVGSAGRLACATV